jgi:hypothetical protein
VVTYSTNFARWGGYSFDENSVYELADQVKEFSGVDAELEASLQGGHIITGKNAQEFVAEAFLKNNMIEQLIIQAWDIGADPHRSIQIILRDRTFFDAVSVGISGERQASMAARMQIQSIIGGGRHWYALFYPHGWWSSVLSFILWLLIVAILAELLSLYSSAQWPVALFVAVVGGSLVGSAGMFVLRKMFPKVVFEIGTSKRKGETARFWRMTVGSVLILGIVAAVIGGLIVEKLK